MARQKLSQRPTEARQLEARDSELELCRARDDSFLPVVLYGQKSRDKADENNLIDRSSYNRYSPCYRASDRNNVYCRDCANRRAHARLPAETAARY